MASRTHRVKHRGPVLPVAAVQPASATSVDERLRAPGRIPEDVLVEVLKDHGIPDGSTQACAACGYVPTRRQPVCRSTAVAVALRFGRRPEWNGPTGAVTAPAPVGAATPSLFELLDEVG